MRILLSAVSLFLLSSCVLQQRIADINKEKVKESPILIRCDFFPYDESDDPCNLSGWQQFTYQVLNATEAEHKSMLLSLTRSSGNPFKQIILRSSAFEPDDIRQQAIEKMFQISSEYNNGFGQLFYILATYSHNDRLKKQSLLRVEKKLKTQINDNTQLKKQLTDAQTKIQAIMDIEQDLKTN